jgi:hypothetical protein
MIMVQMARIIGRRGVKLAYQDITLSRLSLQIMFFQKSKRSRMRSQLGAGTITVADCHFLSKSMY